MVEKWPNVVENGQVKIGRKWLKKAQNGRKWSNDVKEGKKGKKVIKKVTLLKVVSIWFMNIS